MENHDAIPAGMNALLDLFASELAGVRFGDLDRTALERAAEAVRGAAAELAEAEAAAAAARAALETAREGLLRQGRRALAYARIYAEGSPGLAERLREGALDLGTARIEAGATVVTEAPPRRRGRPPKASSSEGSGTLPLTGSTSGASNGAADEQDAASA